MVDAVAFEGEAATEAVEAEGEAVEEDLVTVAVEGEDLVVIEEVAAVVDADEALPVVPVSNKRANHYARLILGMQVVVGRREVVELEVAVAGEAGPREAPTLHWNPIAIPASSLRKAKSTSSSRRIWCPAKRSMERRELRSKDPTARSLNTGCGTRSGASWPQGFWEGWMISTSHLARRCFISEPQVEPPSVTLRTSLDL